MHSVGVCPCDCVRTHIQVRASACVRRDEVCSAQSVATPEQSRRQLPSTEGMRNIMKNIMKCQSRGFSWVPSKVATC